MKKKKKPKYNQNSQIRSALRRTFSRSPLVQEVLKDARSESVKFNKDGNKAKKPAVRYKCAICGKKFMGKDVAVDHITPVVDIEDSFIDWNIFIERLFCNKDNLQVICSYRLKDNHLHGGEVSCHNKKTREERELRKNSKKK